MIETSQMMIMVTFASKSSTRPSTTAWKNNCRWGDEAISAPFQIIVKHFRKSERITPCHRKHNLRFLNLRLFFQNRHRLCSKARTPGQCGFWFNFGHFIQPQNCETLNSVKLKLSVTDLEAVIQAWIRCCILGPNIVTEIFHSIWVGGKPLYPQQKKCFYKNNSTDDLLWNGIAADKK